MSICKGIALPDALRPAALPQPRGSRSSEPAETNDEINVDLREVYFLIMHFLSSGPCHRATGQLWNELLQHKLLPRRYHGLYSRRGLPSTDEEDDGSSFPLSYAQVTERFQSIDKNHLVKLLQQLLLHDRSASLLNPTAKRPLTAADVPTLLGSGAFSLLESEQKKSSQASTRLLEQLRWPHWHADQVHALALRELGGGFSKHHRSPATRTAKHVLAKPSLLVDRISIIKILRGHRNAVYCAIFDRSGQHLITGSDDRLVKFWSAESGLCLRSCRGHEGDITHLAVSISNTLVASASNDSSIRVWRFPDGFPVAVLRGHTAGVTAIQFRPRQGCEYHLLSSSDDGTCRIWDARDSSINSRVFMPKPDQDVASANGGTSVLAAPHTPLQISCCAFNADGSFFVTGSSDKLARVWDARKWEDEHTGRPNYELDTLSGHEDIVNYVQFSGCAEPARPFSVDVVKDDTLPRFKNSWFAQDSIVTCSKDGSAIIWSPRPRKQVKLGRWVKAYHLKVPPPPMPPPHSRAGGPRQRASSTPRGVNMIVWSLDNRFVLATIMDFRICVWNAVDGSLLHCLTGHKKRTYVLDVHPYNPRIAMSAGYDGRVIIWDIWEGRPVRTYETGDFNLVDGNFSPDGTSLVVSDEVGQVYLFSTGIGTSQKDAQYDQFFLGDFRPLIRDTYGNVLDQETQLPPHQRNLQDLLCDSNMIPYPEPYQSTYQQRRLGALGIAWHPPSVQLVVGTLDDPAYAVQEFAQAAPPVDSLPEHSPHAGGNRWVEQPADIDAMDWDEEAVSDDSGSDYCASEESLSDDEVAAESESPYDDTSDTEPEEPDFESQHEAPTRRSHRNKRRQSFGSVERRKRRRCNESNEVSEQPERRGRTKRSAFADDAQAGRPRRVAARNALSMFSSLNEEANEEGAQARAAAVVEEAEMEDVKAADNSEAGECKRARSQRKLVLKLRNRSDSDPPPSAKYSSEDSPKSDASDHASVDLKKKQRSKKAKLVQTSSSDDGPPDMDEEVAPEAAAHLEPSSPVEGAGRAHDTATDRGRGSAEEESSSESLRNEGTASDDPDYHEEPVGTTLHQRSDSEVSEQDSAERWRRRDSGAGKRSRRNHRMDSRLKDSAKGRRKSSRLAKIADAAASSSRKSIRSTRKSSRVIWEASSSFEESDWSEREGTSLEGDSEVSRPRKRTSVRLRQQQPVGSRVDYRYRSLQLRRKSRGHHTVREPANVAWLLTAEVEQHRYIPQFGDQVVYIRQGHQDYLEQEHPQETGPWDLFKGAMRAVEFCQVVGLDYIILPGSGNTCCDLTLEVTEGNPMLRGETFSLHLPELTQHSDFVVERSRYDCSIARNWSVRDKCLVWWRSEDEGGGKWWEGRVMQVKARSSEFKDSPWDSILVHYKEEPQSDTLHSPWELFDTNGQLWEAPRIDEDSNRILLSAFDEVQNSNQSKDEYGLWTLQQAITRPDFCNEVALPLSMDIIRTRVEKYYYRSLEAVAHDLSTLISNFRSFYGEENACVLKLERLKERFSDILGM